MRQNNKRYSTLSQPFEVSKIKLFTIGLDKKLIAIVDFEPWVSSAKGYSKYNIFVILIINIHFYKKFFFLQN